MFPTGLVIFYVYVFFLGAVIGSFMNVLAIRIPRKENFITARSHCDSCGYQLKWYDLVPIFSFVFLRGRCRKCKASISAQHLIAEVLNGLLYILIIYFIGIKIETILYLLAASALVALSLIDLKTQEIPVGFNYFILALGIIRLLLDLEHWSDYVIGFFAVSVFLLILIKLSNGRAMGGGDMKLMAAAGVLIGWKLIILSFLLGCILGAIIHPIRMAISKESNVLALGPYLAAGIIISLLWGNQLLAWYLSFF